MIRNCVGTVMMVKRITTFGLILLTMGGCSRLPLGSAAYSALPSAKVPMAGTSSVRESTASLGRGASLAPEVIPGTLLTRQGNNGQRGVNPTAALEAPGRDHSLNRPMHSVDHSQAAALANRPRKSSGGEVTATGSTSALAPSEGDRPFIDMQDHNREAAMDQLVAGGNAAAKPICSGC